MGLRKRNQGAAFDAASSSGMAFLNSQLELANNTLVQPLASSFYKRDITVKVGGGYPEYLTAYQADYATTGGNQFGLQGTSNTDIPEIQVSVGKGLWKTWIWKSTFIVTFTDLQRLNFAKRNGQPAPFSLNTLLDNGVKLAWNKAMDYVVYLGFDGQPGLVNNPAVTSSLVPNGAAGTTTWATKTGLERYNDLNNIVLSTISSSAYDIQGMANRILVPWNQYVLLSQPMVIGGTPVAVSVLAYFADNNIGKKNGVDVQIFPLANPYISGQGVGNTDRMVAYRDDESDLYIHVPQPIQKEMTLPTTRAGGAYETIFGGCIGQVQVLRTQTIAYGDGI